LYSIHSKLSIWLFIFYREKVYQHQKYPNHTSTSITVQSLINFSTLQTSFDESYLLTDEAPFYDYFNRIGYSAGHPLFYLPNTNSWPGYCILPTQN
jgi:hypothetical protein